MAAITGAVVGAVTAAVSIGMSVSSANKAAADKEKAAKTAKAAMEEARREIDIMPLQELAINTDIYKQQQEASNVAAAQGIEAAQQGQGRQLASTVGRLNQLNIAAQDKTRVDLGVRLDELELLKAEDRADASLKKETLAYGEAKGAMAQAADAQTRQTASIASGVEGGVNLLSSAGEIYEGVQGPYDPDKKEDATITTTNPANIQ